jgi:hypothetical protein
MEKAIAVLCFLVIGVSAVDGVVEIADLEVPGFSTEDVNPDEGQWSEVQTVTMPENMIGDNIQYDLITRIELYFENKTSGEWTYWALDVGGQQLIDYRSTAKMIDGFGAEHSTLIVDRDIYAGFTVYLDDSEGEQVTSKGEFDAQREEYTDLMELKTVRIDTNANISVDELPSTNIPLSFRGFTRSYFDVNLPLEETLEDGIYGKQQTISVGDTGEWTDETTWNDVKYSWEAQKAKKISGYDTVLVNVTTDFGDDDWSLPFMNLIWISNDVSVPVKQFIRTNTSWDTDEEAGYILLENTFVLIKDGFTRGIDDIPNDCSGAHWLQEHPYADKESWSGNFMPVSGDGWEESSFHWKPEEAIDWLERDHPSDDLADFLSQNPDAIVTSANYNASVDDSDPNGHAGEFWWNLTFGIERQDGQSYYGAENRYTALIYNNTEWDWDLSDPLNRKVVYDIEHRVELDMGKRGGSSPLSPRDIESQTVTMASSEKIFKTDNMVLDAFYAGALGSEREELEWGNGDDSSYSLGTSSGEQGFGMDLIATLTGIETQIWGKYTWSLSKEDLMEGGVMASISLDAETGRLITYMEIEGTALANAFNFD